MQIETGNSRGARRLFDSRAYVLFILVLVYTFNFIDRQIVGILAVPIKADLGLSDGQLGLMGGLAFALFYTGLGIPVAFKVCKAHGWELKFDVEDGVGTVVTISAPRIGQGSNSEFQ